MRALYCSLLCLLVSLMAAPSEAQLGDFLRRARDRVDEIKEEVDEVRDREEDSATGSNVPAAPSAGLSTAQMAAECEARAESDARFRTCARVCLQARNSGSQDQACRNIYTVTTTAPVSQSPGPRANAAPPALVSAEFGPSVVLDAPSARMTSIKIPAFNSLPRIGIQDSRGVSDTRKRNDMSSEVRQQLTRRERDQDRADVLLPARDDFTLGAHVFEPRRVALVSDRCAGRSAGGTAKGRVDHGRSTAFVRAGQSRHDAR